MNNVQKIIKTVFLFTLIFSSSIICINAENTNTNVQTKIDSKENFQKFVRILVQQLKEQKEKLGLDSEGLLVVSAETQILDLLNQLYDELNKSDRAKAGGVSDAFQNLCGCVKDVKKLKKSNIKIINTKVEEFKDTISGVTLDPELMEKIQAFIQLIEFLLNDDDLKLGTSVTKLKALACGVLVVVGSCGLWKYKGAFKKKVETANITDPRFLDEINESPTIIGRDITRDVPRYVYNLRRSASCPDYKKLVTTGR